MRELAKSFNSFSWSLSLFGVRQLTRVLTPQGPEQRWDEPRESFDALTRVAEADLGPSLTKTFKAVDELQRGAVDASFGLVKLDWRNISQSSSDLLQRTAQAFREVFSRPR